MIVRKPSGRAALLMTLLAVFAAGCGATRPTVAPASDLAATTPNAEPPATPGASVTSRATPRPTNSPSCPPFQPADPDPAAVAETGPSEPMPTPELAGEPMVLQGILLDWQCNPRPNTRFSIWHIDVRGYYGPGQLTGEGPECCWYEAEITTDADARFEIHSIRPGSEVGSGGERVPHIHAALAIEAAFNPDTTILFEGDEPLEGGPGPRVVYATKLERRSGDDGRYWWGFVVLRL